MSHAKDRGPYSVQRHTHMHRINHDLQPYRTSIALPTAGVCTATLRSGPRVQNAMGNVRSMNDGTIRNVHTQK